MSNQESLKGITELAAGFSLYMCVYNDYVSKLQRRANAINCQYITVDQGQECIVMFASIPSCCLLHFHIMYKRSVYLCVFILLILLQQEN